MLITVGRWPRRCGARRARRRRLAIHIGVAAVIAVLLVVRWVMGIGPDDDGAGFDGPGFWPVFPLFWISLSVLFHYRRAQRWAR